jgi:hypothetical protein
VSGADPGAKAVVRELVARINGGGDAWALLSETAVVTVNGTTPLSGRYPGIALVRGILVDTARRVIASLEVRIDELIGSGVRVAALLRISGRNANGMPLNTEGRQCGCLFGIERGLIEEVILFPDTSLIEIALYGRRYVSDA